MVSARYFFSCFVRTMFHGALVLLMSCATDTQQVRRGVEISPVSPAPRRQEIPHQTQEVPRGQNASLKGQGFPKPVGQNRVLFLGDSLSVGEFGRTFDQALRNRGFEVYTSVAGGGTPYYWLREYPPVSIDITYWERTPSSQRRLPRIQAVPKVETLISKWNPDIIVVQTGTNLYAPLRSKKRSKAANVKEVESVVEKMCRVTTDNGCRKLYWITPPEAHTKRYPQALQDEMLAITQRVAGKYGPVFNSYQVTSYTEPYPSSDGIHLGRAQAKRWAESVSRDFCSQFRSSRELN
jgi:hypothetical protein